MNQTDKGLYVQADAYRVKQVTWKLLVNSVEAMSIGGLISIRSRAQNGDVMIEISDEGRGIDESMISRIFDPFFTTKEFGTELGLATVQKVIEGYNERINVVSLGGKGATFVITLPKFEKLPADVVSH